jgi:predicted O-methyltransferase YrrM
MPSDIYIGTLLKTLITSKPNSNLLELGTGIGLPLPWMIDGMDSTSKLTTVDNDPELISPPSKKPKQLHLGNNYFDNQYLYCNEFLLLR